MPRVVVAGASGPIGRALVRTLLEQGAAVCRLVRRPQAGPGEVTWDPEAGTLDPRAFDGADAVVNLAGRSIASLRWTAAVRREILDSRVRSTRLLVDAIRNASVAPPVLVSASATGYYGDRDDEVLDESSSPGHGFLADIAQAWEAEARRATRAGTRVVCARFGIVLSRDGGLLRAMRPLFRAWLGGPLGGGRQWWSWIHVDDAAAALSAAMRIASLEGPVNVVSPSPVTNREFARALGAALGRPAALRVPAFALRLSFGQVADEMMLASQRAVPAKLQAHGFRFRWPGLEPALCDLLSGPPGASS
ncbi:MAG: TIGR01777 family protein [Armatimonadetes bacterium]|nr:TIGR01777 family protein [Armatimonadota bacterium]